MDPSGASLVPPPGLNFLRILANSTSMREDSSSLDLALRRSVMKLLRPRAWDDMVDGGYIRSVYVSMMCRGAMHM